MVRNQARNETNQIKKLFGFALIGWRHRAPGERQMEIVCFPVSDANINIVNLSKFEIVSMRNVTFSFQIYMH